MHRKKRHILVGIRGRITPEGKLGTEYLLEEGIPLASQHVVIRADTPGLGEHRDELGHQERVDGVDCNLHRGVIGEGIVDDPAV